MSLSLDPLHYKQVEPAAIADQMGLLKEHWDEVAKNKDLMVLEPDTDRYNMMYDAGKLLILAAYDGPYIVGYSVNIIDYHLHYAGLKVCSNDLLFVSMAWRTTPLGLGLMRHTRQMARRSGAKLMLWHAKQDSSLDKIMRHSRRVKVQDIIYSEQL